MSAEKSNAPQEHGVPAATGSAKSLILLLLAILAGGAYLYFFTDIIKPLDGTSKKTEPNSAQAVKQPLPPRPGEQVDSRKNVASESKKELAITPAGKQQSGVNKEKSAALDKAVQSQPVKTGSAVNSEKNTESKTKNVAVVKSVDKTSGNSTVAKQKSIKAADKKAFSENKNLWTVVVGNYAVEEKLAADMTRIKQAGFSPSIKDCGRSRRLMYRLFAGSYANKERAEDVVADLKSASSDIFILKHQDRYTIYTGSYAIYAKAVEEKERLEKAGYNVHIQNTNVSVPTKQLLLEAFANKESAEAAIDKLKQSGISATLSR